MSREYETGWKVSEKHAHVATKLIEGTKAIVSALTNPPEGVVFSADPKEILRHLFILWQNIGFFLTTGGAIDYSGWIITHDIHGLSPSEAMLERLFTWRFFRAEVQQFRKKYDWEGSVDLNEGQDIVIIAPNFQNVLKHTPTTGDSAQFFIFNPENQTPFFMDRILVKPLTIYTEKYFEDQGLTKPLLVGAGTAVGALLVDLSERIDLR